ncbi:hypothetical protein NL676_030902 [Syzygium grande]|nr:hypothetical protein NL676_030902 [Syzygium grande]
MCPSDPVGTMDGPPPEVRIWAMCPICMGRTRLAASGPARRPSHMPVWSRTKRLPSHVPGLPRAVCPSYLAVCLYAFASLAPNHCRPMCPRHGPLT